MDASKPVELNSLQRAIIVPVVGIISRHRRDCPISKKAICDDLNRNWYGIVYPKESPGDKIVTRDIEKVVQHLRTLPKKERIYFGSNGKGYFLPETIEDFDVVIKSLESRIKNMARNLRCAKAEQKDLALGTGTPKAIQPDIFCPAEKSPPGCAGGGNLLQPSPGNGFPGGGGLVLIWDIKSFRIDAPSKGA